MGDVFRVNPTESIGRRLRLIALSAVVIFAGMLIGSAFEYGAKFSDGIGYVGCFGIAIGWPLVGILVATLWIMHLGLRWATRGRLNEYAVCILAVVIGLALVIAGYVTSRPINRIRNYVLDPPPASLTDVQLHRRTSASDGGAWMFSFHLSPGDFEKFVQARGLRRIPVDWTARQREADELGEEPRWEDDLLLRDWPEVYKRPPQAEFYQAGRLLVVAEPRHDHVFVYLDQWRLHAAPTSSP
jgi:hypothetical protein